MIILKVLIVRNVNNFIIIRKNKTFLLGCYFFIYHETV